MPAGMIANLNTVPLSWCTCTHVCHELPQTLLWPSIGTQLVHLHTTLLHCTCKRMLRTLAAACCSCHAVWLKTGLVVVVSPLLALMRDQLDRLPKGLPGAMLQGSMNRQEVEQVGAHSRSRGAAGCSHVNLYGAAASTSFMLASGCGAGLLHKHYTVGTTLCSLETISSLLCALHGALKACVLMCVPARLPPSLLAPLPGA